MCYSWEIPFQERFFAVYLNRKKKERKMSNPRSNDSDHVVQFRTTLYQSSYERRMPDSCYIQYTANLKWLWICHPLGSLHWTWYYRVAQPYFLKEVNCISGHLESKRIAYLYRRNEANLWRIYFPVRHVHPLLLLFTGWRTPDWSVRLRRRIWKKQRLSSRFHRQCFQVECPSEKRVLR